MYFCGVKWKRKGINYDYDQHDISIYTNVD